MIPNSDMEEENKLWFSDEEKRKMWRGLFFTIVWIVFINGALTLITMHHYHPTMDFVDLFNSIPDAFMWNFKIPK
jgi:hypothetical protein